MLTPEQAKALQEQRRYMSDQPRRLRAIDWLPEPLRPIAYGLLYHDAHGKPLGTDLENRAERHVVRDRAIAQLDTLAPHQRMLIFAAFFPSVPECIERGWTYLYGLPYEGATYYRQEFFRAPHRPDATLRARGRWLTGLLGTIGPHDELGWLARHAAYIGDEQLALLFAAAIDADPEHGAEVLEILMRSARGEDEIGTFGRYIPVALLAASRPEGWECVERILLGAQREEGVRQTILEALDVAHPGAFRHLLETILDHRLDRFSAVTCAVNGWLDTAWDSDQAPAVTRVLRSLHALLGDPDARSAALACGSGEDAYLALWVIACEDVYAALPLAERLLQDAEVTRRYAAARLLATAHVPEATALLVRALDDPDARVIAQACVGLRFNGSFYLNESFGSDPGERLRLGAPDAFERIEAVLPRLPRKPVPAPPLLWNVPIPPLDRARAADLLIEYLGERDPKRLIPYVDLVGAHVRVRIAQRLAEHGLADAEVRAALLGLLKGRDGWVRGRAFSLLEQAPMHEAEIPLLDALLARRPADLRQGVLRMLLRQPDDLALASVDRLLAARQEQQRLAGLELVRLLHEAGRAVEGCAARAAAYRARHPDPAEAERVLLGPILDAPRDVPTLDDALDLVRLDELTPQQAPRPRGRPWTSPAAVAGLLALDALIDEHRADAYVADSYGGRQEVLLGGDPWRFPHPDGKVAIAQDVARLPFADLWQGWAEARAAALRDEDGLEVLRMLIQTERRGADVTRAILANLGGADATRAIPAGRGAPDAPRLALRYPAVVGKLCWWLVRLFPAPDAPDFLLDHLETELTEIPERELREPEDPAQRPRYREYQRLQQAAGLCRNHRAQCPANWTDARVARLWRLLRWSTTLPQEHLRSRPSVAEALAAYRAGAASEVDLVYQFLGPRASSGYGPTTFDELHTFSSRKPDPLLADYPIAATLYARCLERVLEVELQRGEMPTAATPVALSLRSLSGTAWFVRLLRALGDAPLARGHAYGDAGTSKANTLSHLLHVSFPAPEETPAAFAEQVAAARVPQRRLVEAAVYAPQWARHVEHALGWEGFAEAVWWLHAHTKDRNWAADAAIRQEWEAQISERTPLSGAELNDGAVDVAWFHRVYARLGAARWETLYQAAKYSSSGTGHARARLFADAMRGTVEEQALAGRIAAKRSRDAACALGLLALPRGKRAREQVLLARYRVLQEFIRTARGFGAQRREGDQKAARIGLDNLARTAGYPDAQRFQWAMELREADDLTGGALVVARGDVTLTLRLDALDQPHLDVARAGRPLKAIPVRLKKDPEVMALRARATALEQQLARMRLALEQAMCREEAFTADELRQLLRHPLLAPLLEQLVFVAGDVLGYPVDGGRALRSCDGDETTLGPAARPRIAHPHDLYRLGAWSRWQRECFAAERIQPFKQVFRELYPLTEAERQDGDVSRRYAGHQLQPRQAMALLGQRGWVASGEQGGATRTFHGRGITAWVSFLFAGGTAAEVEGPTVEEVTFRAAGEEWGRRLALAEVPPVVFSEAMRDLDLVVSVAHSGGVDPEGSASTVEMRAALVREVGAALGLANVRLEGSRALIRGALGEYALHLGSGTVHRLPGGALCIVPVHAQQRGRLFLPFVDDDPKTTEVVSKVLLLARDAEIKDPLILQQIYAAV